MTKFTYGFIVDEAIIKRTADIMGEHSASAKCLEAAKKLKEPVFFKTENGLMVLELSLIHI